MEAKTSFFENEIRKQKESRRYVISAWVKCNFEDEFSWNYVVEERGFGCSPTGDYSWSHLNSVGLMHFDSVEEAEEWFSAHKKVLCEGPRTVIEPAVSEVVCNVAKDLSFEK